MVEQYPKYVILLIYIMCLWLWCCSLYPNNEVSPDDVCVIPYSSGTSGKPKGVQLVHRSIMANLFQCSHPDFNQIGTKDTIMGFLPFYHIYGMVVVCSLVRCGFYSFHRFLPYYRMTSKNQQFKK